MPPGPAFDDGAIDAILGGTALDGDDAPLVSFVEDVRRAFGFVPPPNPALAAALASGVVSSPVASAPPVEPGWRRFRQKLQGAVASLGIAGKVLLGAGAAAAATTGAGAAGVLPGPVQDFVADAVGAVTPFDLPGGSGGARVQVAHDADADDPTDVATTTTTSTPKEPKKKPKKQPVVVATSTTTSTSTTVKKTEDTTPTTQKKTVETTPTTLKKTEDTTPTTKKKYPPKSTTTVKPDEHAAELALTCVRKADPKKITCEWSASPSDKHDKYKLIRWDGSHESVVFYSHDGTKYVDFDVHANKLYKYRVYSKDHHGNVVAYSERVSVYCCGN